MIRREIFNKAGGFDAQFGLGTYEDVDLCVKCNAMGKRVFVNAEAIAYHYAGATAEKKNVAYPLRENAMLFLLKWQRSPMLMWDEFTWYIPDQPKSLEGNYEHLPVQFSDHPE